MEHRVFISSTYVDLKEFRKEVIKFIQRLGGADKSMERFGARDERPLEECVRVIRDESDVFVGIYAHRYGFVPKGETKSITELEYEAATLAGLPRFIYLVSDEAAWKPANFDKGASEVRLRRFKQRLKSDHICETFSTEYELAAMVAADLGRYFSVQKMKHVSPPAPEPPSYDRKAGIKGLKKVGPSRKSGRKGGAKVGGSKKRASAAAARDDYFSAAAAAPAEYLLPTPREGYDESLAGARDKLARVWNENREGTYQETRRVFLAHVITPSKVKGQKFDVFIYLVRSPYDNLKDLSDVTAAEFFLGPYWGSKVFKVPNAGGLVGISTSAYGPFLCTCRVTFRDGYQVYLNRYIDFEMERVFR
ncbi:MAG: DUF4062 domain-containing protein [Acidobacteria bacterium]|nr:DUF4062 domain-containing protein [Acidobacteriota bacterium]